MKKTNPTVGRVIRLLAICQKLNVPTEDVGIIIRFLGGHMVAYGAVPTDPVSESFFAAMSAAKKKRKWAAFKAAYEIAFSVDSDWYEPTEKKLYLFDFIEGVVTRRHTAT